MIIMSIKNAIHSFTDFSIGGAGVLCTGAVDTMIIDKLDYNELNVTLELVLQIIIASTTLFSLYHRNKKNKPLNNSENESS